MCLSNGISSARFSTSLDYTDSHMLTDRTVRLGLHDEHAKVGDHIAYFWETPGEFAAAVTFLEVGLDLGDCCVIFGHDEANAKVRALDNSSRKLFGVSRSEQPC